MNRTYPAGSIHRHTFWDSLPVEIVPDIPDTLHICPKCQQLTSGKKLCQRCRDERRSLCIAIPAVTAYLGAFFLALKWLIHLVLLLEKAL